MERVAKATGARTQTTVNGLTAESAKSFLGTCKRFEEQQVCVCGKTAYGECEFGLGHRMSLRT